MWKIGNREIHHQIVLAPMAGISNPSFFRIVEEMGVGYAVTELISAEAIVRNNKKTLEMLHGIETLSIPIGIQLFGSNPETFTLAAKKINEKYPNALIDINMGCPVPKVAMRAQAGSALLKDPEKVLELVSNVVEAVPVPVTVKIRSGWDSDHINAVEIATVIEKAGAKALAIHGRTRAQGYTGEADWKIIKQVKEAVTIPVIGNGDVKSCYDAKRMLDETGCDAVMIGRGVLGNPWLIKECVAYLENGTEPVPVSPSEKLQMLRRHFELLLENKSEKLALLEIRSHAAWYLKGIPGASEWKNKIVRTQMKEELLSLMDQMEREWITKKS